MGRTAAVFCTLICQGNRFVAAILIAYAKLEDTCRKDVCKSEVASCDDSRQWRRTERDSALKRWRVVKRYGLAGGGVLQLQRASVQQQARCPLLYDDGRIQLIAQDGMTQRFQVHA